MHRQTRGRVSLAALFLAILIGSLTTADIASADRDGHRDRGRGNGDHPRGRPAQIAWEQRAVAIVLAPGETKAVTVRFAAREDIAHATLAVRPRHAPLDVEPEDLGAVRANQSYSLTLTAHLPPDERRPHRRVQVAIRDGQRALGPPLRVVIRNSAAAERDEDDEDEDDAALRWTPPAVRAAVLPGDTYTTTVGFIARRDLRQARITANAHDGLTLAVSPSDLGTVAANQPVTLTLTAQVPAGAERERFAAEIAVREGPHGEKLEPVLALLLRLPGAGPFEARVRWAVPMTVATVRPGEIFTTTVSFVADRELSDGHVRLRAQRGLELTAAPMALGRVAAGRPVTLTLAARVPSDSSRPFFFARVAIADGDDVLRGAHGLLLGVLR